VLAYAGEQSDTTIPESDEISESGPTVSSHISRVRIPTHYIDQMNWLSKYGYNRMEKELEAVYTKIA
jgi:hypothetical protein